MKTNNTPLTNPRQVIVLMGFMGSGKTTIGRDLAGLLGRQFIDLDNYIEQKENMTVSAIFDKKGQAYFRKLEERFTKRLARRRNLVLSLGGGTVLNPKNVKALKKRGSIIYLEVTADTVLKRLENDSSRPLLSSDKENTVRKLLEEREPIYKGVADFTADGNNTKDKVINDILNILTFGSEI